MMQEQIQAMQKQQQTQQQPVEPIQPVQPIQPAQPIPATVLGGQWEAPPVDAGDCCGMNRIKVYKRTLTPVSADAFDWEGDPRATRGGSICSVACLELTPSRVRRLARALRLPWQATSDSPLRSLTPTLYSSTRSNDAMLLTPRGRRVCVCVCHDS